jgi:glycoside/pentoside/hexuronide:cation symporter, GPH family
LPIVESIPATWDGMTQAAILGGSGDAPGKSTIPPQRTPGVLSVGEKIGYALGDSASNFYWKVFEFYLLFFYTDVFGLTPGAAAWLLLSSRVWDAVNDPLMGALADRTRSKWGKFRPYLLWIALPIWAAGVLMFTTPDLDESGKLVYAYVTYVFMMMMYTAINIPYSALMGVITPSTQERSQLSSWRFIGAFTVALVVQTFTMRFVGLAGDGNPEKGFQLVMLAYGGIAALLFVISFLTTRERVHPPEKQSSHLPSDLSALLANTPWKIMFGMGVLVIAGFALRGGTLMYYFKYYLNDEKAFEAFMFSGGIAALLGTIVMPLGTRLLGKRRLYVACMGSAGLLTIPYYFLPPDASGLIYGLNIAIAFLLGPTAPLIFVMFTDTADYGEWKTGRRTTGLIMAAAMLSLKFGGAIGGFFNAKVLELYGFVPNQAQSTESLQGILLLMGVIPAVTALGAAGLALLYPLSDERMGEIESELELRRRAT